MYTLSVMTMKDHLGMSFNEAFYLLCWAWFDLLLFALLPQFPLDICITLTTVVGIKIKPRKGNNEASFKIFKAQT